MTSEVGDSLTQGMYASRTGHRSALCVRQRNPTVQYSTVQHSTGEISFPVKQYAGLIITHKACHKLTLDNPQSLDGNPIGR